MATPITSLAAVPLSRSASDLKAPLTPAAPLTEYRPLCPSTQSDAEVSSDQSHSSRFACTLSFDDLIDAKDILISQSESPADTLSTPDEDPDVAPLNPPSEPAPLAEPSPRETPEPPKYGKNGQGRWYIQGGTGINYNPDAANFFGLAGVGITHFFADGHSISGELNTLAFNQAGSDAVGLNLGIIARWHFYRQRKWSLYIDGGVGIIGTTGDVPPGGTQFNFTPQVGGGASLKIAKERRLLLGLRWHHISNANLFDNNPGQDAIMGYVGLELPR